MVNKPVSASADDPAEVVSDLAAMVEDLREELERVTGIGALLSEIERSERERE